VPLYAMSSNRDRPFLRVPLSDDVAGVVEAMLTRQLLAFAKPDTEEITFDGRLTPDDSQLAVIADFAGAGGLLTAIASPLSLPMLESGDMSALVGFAGVLGGHGDVVVLQCFDGRQVLARTGVGVLFLQGVLERLQDPGFVIRDNLDGILVISEQALKFRLLAPMRRLFDMTLYYREATAGDLIHFAALPEIIADAENLSLVADTWIRRKVAFVVDTGMLAHTPAADLVAHAASFGITLETGEKDGRECIVLPPERGAMKLVLRFLDDDYLKSEATGRQYVANSKRIIKT